MKKQKSLVCSLLLMSLVSLSACDSSENQSSVSSISSQNSSEISSEKVESSSLPSTLESSSNAEDSINTITISEAIEICTKTGETVTTERYYIQGKIKTVSNPTYGEMIIEDDTGSIEVYGTYSKDGSTRYSEMEDKPVAGDTVLLYGTLVNYNLTTPEIKSGWIISFTHNELDIDKSEYSDVSILQARSSKEGTKVKVTGIVGKITYAFGLKPSGFILIDSTSSIYVYSNDVAAQVEVGNMITIYASKTYYISDSEKTNAELFGYLGCNQLMNAYLESNDKLNNEIDFSWCEEKTIKEIMDTPVSNDITTLTYKVNGLIKKAEGTGFTNYYIDDLDEKTGSYVYTQCNGSDFSYLDEFDGKICTIYLTAFNAKSSSSGCVWRFLPVAVKDENYTFDLNGTADFAYEYYIKDQFKEVYTGDPCLQLITSVSSTLLGFENVSIEYKSSDSTILDIVTENSKQIFHCYKNGTATISISITYNGSTITKELPVEVFLNNETYETLSANEAYESELNTEVVVKGIVGASLVNQTGFYLIDETGAIAIRTTSDVISQIEIGNEVIIKGIRTCFNSKDSTSTSVGQSCIKEATLVSNNYGKADYSTSSFIESNIETLVSISGDYTITEKAYIVEGYFNFAEYTYYSTVSISDGTNSLSLYTSAGSQYNWVKTYITDLENTKVKIDVMLNCWNGKVKGSVLAITLQDGTKIANPYNFNK